MGAWGRLAFDNDDANDWAFDLVDTDDLSLVETALQDVAEVGDAYLEAPMACNALAACEVLARCLGNHGYRNAYTEKIDDWVASHKLEPTTALLKLGEHTLDRILGDDSELLQLWDESGDAASWRESVEDLRRRLRRSE